MLSDQLLRELGYHCWESFQAFLKCTKQIASILEARFALDKATHQILFQ